MNKTDSKLPPVIPDARTPRLYGRLTILIASTLLVFNLFSLGFYAASPVLRPLGDRLEKWGSRVVEEQTAKQLELLKKKAAAAKPADQAKLNAAVIRLQAQPFKINSMTFSLSTANTPQVRAYGIADAISGLVLNTAMLLGAIGLVSLKPSGYQTTWWVAWLKLLRIGLLGVLMMGWILPIQLREMRAKLADALPAGAGGRMPAIVSPEGLAATTTSSVIFFGLISMIYPILLIVQLRKARVRAACGILADDKPIDGSLE